MSEHHHPDEVDFSKHGLGDAEHEHKHEYHNTRVLGWALLLTGAFAFVEFASGFMTHSLALISDAGHMLTDSASLALAFFALKMSLKKAPAKLSFGYPRVEVVAAFINGLTMAGIVLWILVKAIFRFFEPVEVNGEAVTWVAVVGLVINLLVAWLLHRGSSNMNTRAALVHVMGDILGSVAAIVAGIVISTTGWMAIDPLLSIVVALLIVRSTWAILKESALHLMDAVPDNIDFNEVGLALSHLYGVKSVHDLHVWDMSPGQPAVMAHVVLMEGVLWDQWLDDARLMMRDRFEIEHVTLQPEHESDEPHALTLERMHQKASTADHGHHHGHHH